MINGTNTSGKKFDVVDEDGEVLGSFDDMADALACGKAAPWFAGQVTIRRDSAVHHSDHQRNQEILRANRLAFPF